MDLPSDPSEECTAVIKVLGKACFFNNHTARASSRFKQNGLHLMVSNISGPLEYGALNQEVPKPRLRVVFEDRTTIRQAALKYLTRQPLDSRANSCSSRSRKSDGKSLVPLDTQTPWISLTQPTRLAFSTLGIFSKRTKGRIYYPVVHIYLECLWNLVNVRNIRNTTEKIISWMSFCFDLHIVPAESRIREEWAWVEGSFKPKEGETVPLLEGVPHGQAYKHFDFPPIVTAELKVSEGRTHDLPIFIQPSMEMITWAGQDDGVRTDDGVTLPRKALQPSVIPPSSRLSEMGITDTFMDLNIAEAWRLLSSKSNAAVSRTMDISMKSKSSKQLGSIQDFNDNRRVDQRLTRIAQSGNRAFSANFLQSLAFLCMISLATASEVGKQDMLSDSLGWPFGPGLPPFDGWPIVLFSFLTGGGALFFARRFDASSPISGIGMGVSAFVGMYIIGDEATSPTAFWT